MQTIQLAPIVTIDDHQNIAQLLVKGIEEEGGEKKILGVFRSRKTDNLLK